MRAPTTRPALTVRGFTLQVLLKAALANPLTAVQAPTCVASKTATAATGALSITISHLRLRQTRRHSLILSPLTLLQLCQFSTLLCTEATSKVRVLMPPLILWPRHRLLCHDSLEPPSLLLGTTLSSQPKMYVFYVLWTRMMIACSNTWVTSRTRLFVDVSILK